MANPIIREAVAPLAAVVDGVSDTVDAVEAFYAPYSPYKRHYTASDPNMRDNIRLAALGLTPADLAPQPSPFTNSIRKIKNSQKKNSQNMDSANLAKNTYTPGDPTSFIKNSYAKYLKSNNKPDMLKLSDNSTGSGDIGVFDAPDNYTPITPNNPMLPHNAIDTRNHFKQFMPITDVAKSEEYIKKMYSKQAKLNRELAAFNNVQNNQESIQSTVQGSTTPEKKEKPVADTDTPKNPIGNSVKKKVNQKKEISQNLLPVNLGENGEDTSSTANKQPVMTPEQIAYEQAINASNGNESSAIIQDYYNRHGVNKSVDNPKTALSEAQSDYYRYLTGYRRMDPNQAILSMGLDPNKYYYQHDPAYYH